ncbi:MAG: hypothetical protein SFZ03_10200 [Candidatus Melainabacteria bacterium]|nr:hypothetical protein [Candidatus Melainabacteria bacterium]
MPIRKDDSYVSRPPGSHDSAYTIYLPQGKTLIQPEDYLTVWFAAKNFQLHWEHEVLKRKMSRMDWYDALSVMLANVAVKDPETLQAVEIEDVDDIFPSPRWVSEFLRADPATGGPKHLSRMPQRVQVLYIALCHYHLSQLRAFP